MPKSVWRDKEDLVAKIVVRLPAANIDALYEALRGSDAQAPPMADFLDDEDDRPFSEAERTRIADVLNEIKRQAAESDEIPEAELQALEAKLDYLITAAEHTRRKEWLIVAFTVISQPFVNGVLTPTVVNNVLHAVSVGLGSMFGHPMPLLPP